MEKHTKAIERLVETRREDYCRMSDTIWEYAETAFQEVRSSQLQQDYLKDCGFTVETGLAGMPTAFCASYRRGEGPVVAMLGEFDALPPPIPGGRPAGGLPHHTRCRRSRLRP